MRALWLVPLLVGVAACASTSEKRDAANAACLRPPEGRDRVGAELDSLEMYVVGLVRKCPGAELTLRQTWQSNAAEATSPPTTTSYWQLAGCGNALHFNIRCRPLDEGWQCSDEDWPASLHRELATTFSAELEATVRAARAIRCPGGCGGLGCVDAGFAMRLRGHPVGGVQSVEVERCGAAYTGEVACRPGEEHGRARHNEAGACSAILRPRP